MKIKSVSQNLFRQLESKLVIKLVVPLTGLNASDSFYSVFESDRGNYLTLNIVPYLTLQYKTSAPFDKSQTVRIGEMDMVSFINGLKLFYQRLNRQDLFTYYKSGDITCEPRKSDKVTISFKSGDFIELEPGVICNVDGSPLPGVYLYLNQKGNKTELSIDEFEFLLYKVNKIDLSSDGMKLVMTKLMLDRYLDETFKSNKTNSSSKDSYQQTINDLNIFQRKKMEQLKDEEPIDNRIIYDSPKSLDDLI